MELAEIEEKRGKRKKCIISIYLSYEKYLFENCISFRLSAVESGVIHLFQPIFFIRDLIAPFVRPKCDAISIAVALESTIVFNSLSCSFVHG